MMLSGVALSAISGLFSVLIESWWVRGNTIIAQYRVVLPTAAILAEVLAVYGKKFVPSIGMYFAMVNDPDGNTILLSPAKRTTYRKELGTYHRQPSPLACTCEESKKGRTHVSEVSPCASHIPHQR